MNEYVLQWERVHDRTWHDTLIVCRADNAKQALEKFREEANKLRASGYLCRAVLRQ